LKGPRSQPADGRRLPRVLLVDVGNTRIKWAMWSQGRLSQQRAEPHAGWRQADFARRLFSAKSAPARIIVASVAGSRIERALVRAASRALHVKPELLRTTRQAGGVTTRYVDPWRLGVDRFMAAIGAHWLAGARPACVVNVGTAVTIDLIDGRGVHRGGVIVPGPELMVRSLLSSTAGIERRAWEPRTAARDARASRSASRPQRISLFARNTRSAIEQGAAYAVAAVIDRAVSEAAWVLHGRPLVLLSGGAAVRVEPLVRSRHVTVRDLVLRGIAIHAGLPLQ